MKKADMNISNAYIKTTHIISTDGAADLKLQGIDHMVEHFLLGGAAECLVCDKVCLDEFN